MRSHDRAKPGPGAKCLCPDGVIRRARIYKNGRARVSVRTDDRVVAIMGAINADNRFIPWVAGKNGRFFEGVK